MYVCVCVRLCFRVGLRTSTLGSPKHASFRLWRRGWISRTEICTFLWRRVPAINLGTKQPTRASIRLTERITGCKTGCQSLERSTSSRTGAAKHKKYLAANSSHGKVLSPCKKLSPTCPGGCPLVLAVRHLTKVCQDAGDILEAVSVRVVKACKRAGVERLLLPPSAPSRFAKRGANKNKIRCSSELARDNASTHKVR